MCTGLQSRKCFKNRAWYPLKNVFFFLLPFFLFLALPPFVLLMETITDGTKIKYRQEVKVSAGERSGPFWEMWVQEMWAMCGLISMAQVLGH